MLVYIVGKGSNPFLVIIFLETYTRVKTRPLLGFLHFFAMSSVEISKKEKKEAKEIKAELEKMISSAGFEVPSSEKKKEKKDKKRKKEDSSASEEVETKKKKEKKETNAKSEKKESSSAVSASSANSSALFPEFKVTCVSESNETFNPVSDFKSIGIHSK